jgi:hypothetical protein
METSFVGTNNCEAKRVTVEGLSNATGMQGAASTPMRGPLSLTVSHTKKAPTVASRGTHAARRSQRHAS